MDQSIASVVDFLGDTSVSAFLVFGNRVITSKDDPNNKRKKIKTAQTVITYSNLADDVIEEYRKSFMKQAQSHLEDRRMRYNGSDFDPAGYQFYKVADIPDSASVIRPPKDSEVRLTFDDAFIKTLRFTIFRFQNSDGKEVLFIRAYPKSKFLKKKDGLILHGGVLSFTESDIVVADPVVDCIVIDDEILIFRRKSFEKIFNFRKIFEKHMKEVFDEIAEEKIHYTVQPVETLKEEIVRDMRKLRKLTSITEKKVYQRVTFEHIIDFEKENKIGAKIDAYHRTITFEDAYAFLHFYNDDNLESRLTNAKYLSLSKKDRISL